MFIRKSKRLPRIVIAALLLTMTAWLLPGELTVENAEAAVTLKDPVIVKDSSMTSGQKVTWDCIYFGSYPQREVIADESSYDAIYEGYYNKDTDVIEDAALFSKLENATGWDSNGDITIDGSKYRRMKKSDATYGTSGSDYNYNWKDATLYHYFKYEPIKWRVLDVNGSDAFLLADRALDDQRYNTKSVSMTWEKSTMRSWLNGYSSSENTQAIDYTGSNFINSALTSSQRNAVKTTDVVNDDSIILGTEGGNDTKDKVFLLSESEVYDTTEAESYGFLKAGDTYDEGRRSRSSTYAKAMGVCTISSTYGDNCWWWLRSPGRDTNRAADVDTYGRVSRISYDVDYDSPAVRPALHLNISSSDLWSYAGTVSSDGSATVAVDKVTLNKSSLTLEKGTSEKLSATISPSDATNKEVTWTSDNEEIATVSSDGTVKALSKGTANITVKTADGGKTASCRVTVNVAVSKVTLNKSSIALERGSTEKLSATISPSDATNKEVTWTSDNENVATVSSDGIVTAVYMGTAKITVTTEDGGHTASCAVTVEKADPQYTPPENLVAYCGDKLSDVHLPDGFKWNDASLSVGKVGVNAFKATYTPEDTSDYNIISDIELKVNVSHKWNETETVDKEPTCTETGFKSIHCTICDAVKEDSTKAIPATGHMFSQKWTVDKEGSCTEAGSKSHHCLNEGCSEKSDVTEIPATGHDFAGWETVKSPDCTNQGSQQRVCRTCSYTETKGIDAKGHTWEADYTTDKEATCTEAGSKSIHCSVCDAIKDSTAIPMKAHDYESHIIPATVNDTGRIIEKCSACGYNGLETVVASPKSFTLSADTYVYSGSAKTPSVSVKDTHRQTLEQGTDYTVSYQAGRKNVGRYAVKITLMGCYEGEQTLYFTINPKSTSLSTLTATKKGFTAKWKKQATQTSGYQIMYATNSKFTSGKKTITVSSNKTTSKKITKLKAKKKYYVRVRTYKKVGSTKYYSSWSKVKTVKTK